MLVSPLASVFLRYFVTLIFVFSFRFTLYSFQGAIFREQICFIFVLQYGGLKWNRTIDLTLIRRAL